MGIWLVTVVVSVTLAIVIYRKRYDISDRFSGTTLARWLKRLQSRNGVSDLVCRDLVEEAHRATVDQEMKHCVAKDGSEWLQDRKLPDPPRMALVREPGSEWLQDRKLPDAIRLTTCKRGSELSITLYDIDEIASEIAGRHVMISNEAPDRIVGVLRDLDILVGDDFIESLKREAAPQCVRFYRTGNGRWGILTNIVVPESLVEQTVDVMPPINGELERSASPNFATRCYFSTIGRFVVSTVPDQKKYQPVAEVVFGIWAFVWLASTDKVLQRLNLSLTIRNLGGLVCIDVSGAKRRHVRRCAKIIDSIIDELLTLEVSDNIQNYCDDRIASQAVASM